VNRLRLLIGFLVYLSTASVPMANAQSYVLGSGDIIAVSFWQQPDMNFGATINEDSTITLPIGGIVKAAGLTTEQLSAAIVEQISLYNRRITHAAVKVMEYGSHKIYVMGNVRLPNKYTFEVIPNLWEIISEAGGPTENANLSNVMIIRSGLGDGEKTITVDLGDALRNKTFDQLPPIMPGDNIYVPAVVGNVPSSGMEAMHDQQNVLFIYGEVGHPGVYTFNKELNLLEALVTAGGPSALAKLEEVKVIRKMGVYSGVTKVNVANYTEERGAAFFLVKGGDTIYVPRKKRIQESVLWDFFMVFTGAVITTFAYSLFRQN
jgi:protein involved in polysaccharide export with SLBB domain